MLLRVLVRAAMIPSSGLFLLLLSVLIVVVSGFQQKRFDKSEINIPDFDIEPPTKTWRTFEVQFFFFRIAIHTRSYSLGKYIF